MSLEKGHGSGIPAQPGLTLSEDAENGRTAMRTLIRLVRTLILLLVLALLAGAWWWLQDLSLIHI